MNDVLTTMYESSEPLLQRNTHALFFRYPVLNRSIHRCKLQAKNCPGEVGGLCTDKQDYGLSLLLHAHA